MSTCKHPLTQIAQKRILSDLKEFEKNDLSSRGVYISIVEEDISNICALIIGPDDTPYEGGFYFFRLEFPTNYPFSPPIVTFLTQDPEYKVRFHPNLYVKGKVCLSMLNTWEGPGWSSIQSLTSVLLTIQSIMENDPLRNEPAYENIEKGTSCLIEYNQAIEYNNLRLAVAYYARKTRNFLDLDTFAPCVEKYFLKHYDKYMKRLNNYQKVNGTDKYYWTQVYQMSTRVDYDYLRRMFEATRQELLARWPNFQKPKQSINTVDRSDGTKKLPKPKIVLKKL